MTLTSIKFCKRTLPQTRLRHKQEEELPGAALPCDGRAKELHTKAQYKLCTIRKARESNMTRFFPQKKVMVIALHWSAMPRHMPGYQARSTEKYFHRVSLRNCCRSLQPQTNGPRIFGWLAQTKGTLGVAKNNALSCLRYQILKSSPRNNNSSRYKAIK